MSENENGRGLIAWCDLTVPDAEAVRDFYHHVVGWQVAEVDMGGYADYCMNEPATGGVEPFAMRFDRDGQNHPHERFHNQYGLLMAMGTHQGLLSAEPKKRPLHGLVVEHRDATGICRVCRAPAPPPYASRQDGLRVCGDEACRQEARRRDNVAKQRRYNARRRAQ